ncbi:hypothetical protein SRB5_22840 [Streptomyces sp. RB5]|uniref:Uncharacterized protein n=1 Tax=Streptomyces smaragdinus TaxID=2585196 RepID=A0A7K0CHC5_9ACTN|nr:hypothetical protein [Streptomyces smaragdinus]MQY12154.1 hypothetical protein [Streptomyces smaragdinus]
MLHQDLMNARVTAALCRAEQRRLARDARAAAGSADRAGTVRARRDAYERAA